MFLNGRELPAIDLFNPIVDISGYARGGLNELQIDVSTTLFNAVESRGSSIETAQVLAAQANTLLAETNPGLNYGLLGPVVVTPFTAVQVA